MHIVVVGSSNTDMIVKTRKIPKPGETVIGGAFSMAAGGKGANQAVAAARAGGRVSFVARVGGDLFGDQSVRGFERDGIDVRHVVRDVRSSSGVALIFVDAKGENSIAVASGANASLSPEDVENAGDAVASADVLLMQLEIPLPAVRTATDIARRHGVPVVLNPAPARPLPSALLKDISVLTPNEHEAGLLTGIRIRSERDAARAAGVLRKKGVPTVIVTMGARGAIVDGAEWSGRISGCRVRAVDTTAAGDVFSGALAVAMAEKMPLPEAVRFACAAAALSVTKMGAQPSAPHRVEIEAFLERRGVKRRREA